MLGSKLIDHIPFFRVPEQRLSSEHVIMQENQPCLFYDPWTGRITTNDPENCGNLYDIERIRVSDNTSKIFNKVLLELKERIAKEKHLRKGKVTKEDAIELLLDCYFDRGRR
ncbi:MAG: hypothetical protein ACYDAP_01405 [Thermoplasmataceae archaeon]